MVSAAMKRLPLFFCLVTAAHAIIATNAQWELRTTGNDNNGGCFVSGGGGTDFSQQNAAQLNFTDLASSNGTNASPQVTSASHNFVAADVGNCIHISAGTNWTTGWYYCVSAAANACTMDRAVGSAASLSGGTYFEGGGLATVGGAVTALNSGRAGANAHTIVGQLNVQTGSYSTTSTLVLSSSGEWQCYGSTHGDNAGTCTITTATNSTDLFHLQGVGDGTALIFDGFTFSNTAGTPAEGFVPTAANSFYLGIRNSTLTGFTIGLDGSNGANFLWLWLDLSGVEVKTTTGAQAVINAGSVSCVGCWIHNNTGIGIQGNLGASNNLNIVIVSSLITNNGGKGVDSHGSFLCVNSDLANNTGDGVGSGSGGATFNTQDCAVYGNGAFGVNAPLVTGSPAPFNMSRANGYGNNTSGPRNNFTAGLSDITLTANPFVSATNFALNGTAGGGAALKNAGFPGAFPGGSTTGSISVGAVQPASTAAACTGFCKMR